MTLGRIGGPMLKENLVRQGVDLAFETDLVYLDVNNMRVGINQAVPQVDLHIDGNTRSGNVQLGGNTISSTDTNGNINITPNGSGSTVLSRISTPNVITSTLASGTAPFIVTSTTQVANLNVATAGSATTAGTVTTAAQPNITSLGTLTGLNVNAQVNATVFSSNVATGTAPFIVTSTTQVANLNVAAAGTAVTASSATTAGTVTTAAQPNITSVGNLTIANIDNIQIDGNTISSTNADGNINLDPNGNGRVIVQSTKALTLPSGLTAERPVGALGDIRVNTNTYKVEFFNGANWLELGTTAQIMGDQFQGDGSTVNFTLSDNATSDSVLVSINGVVQRPGDAYNVTANTLTLVEAPLAGDVIDVRLLASVSATTGFEDGDTSISVNGTADRANITVGGNLVVSVSPTALLPGANVLYDLGSSTMRWNDLWLAGTTIRLGNVVLKDTSGSLGIYQSDGTTPATVVGGTTSSAQTVTVAAQPNITSLGTLTSLNVNAQANATIFSSNVATGTAPFIVQSTTQVANLNVATAGTAATATNAGTVTTASQPNITSLGTLTSLNVNARANATIFSSNIATGTAPFIVQSTTQVANLNVANAGFATNAGTVTTAAQPNITSLGTLTGLTASGQITSTLATGTAPFVVTSTTQVANLNVANAAYATNAGSATSATTAATVTTADQPNITSLGNLTIANVDNMQLNGNAISTTNTNGNLELTPNGTGFVVASGPLQATRFVSTVATGTAPFTVTSTTQVANLNVATAGSAVTFTSTSQNSQFNSIGVGTAASTTTGEIRATNDITAYYSSDRRLKENIIPIQDALSKVQKINGVTFDWVDEEIKKRGGEDGYFVRRHDVGVIAQEVEAVLPEIVATRDNGIKAVKYELLTALLLEAIKELSLRVNYLEELRK